MVTENRLLMPGAFKGLLILLDALRRGIEIKKILEWALMYNLPEIYLSYKHKNLREFAKKYGKHI